MKTALVTGATSGIGRAVVHKLVGDGYRVFAIGRNKEELSALHKKFEDRVVPLQVDLRYKEEVSSKFSFSLEEENLDLVVHAAGILSFSRLENFQTLAARGCET